MAASLPRNTWTEATQQSQDLLGKFQASMAQVELEKQAQEDPAHRLVGKQPAQGGTTHPTIPPPVRRVVGKQKARTQFGFVKKTVKLKFRGSAAGSPASPQSAVAD